MARGPRNGQAEPPEVLLLTPEITDALLELPGLRQLWERWNATRAATKADIPARRDIDVLDLRDCLGNLILLDVIGAGRDFRYRVHGTNIAVAFDQDLTGRLVSSQPPEEKRFLLRLHRRVSRERTPLFCRRRISAGARLQLWDELIVPLAGDGVHVDQTMTAAFPRPDPEREEPEL